MRTVNQSSSAFAFRQRVREHGLSDQPSFAKTVRWLVKNLNAKPAAVRQYSKSVRDAESRYLLRQVARFKTAAEGVVALSDTKSTLRLPAPMLVELLIPLCELIEPKPRPILVN